MKNVRMRKLTMMIGLLLALAIVCSHVFVPVTKSTETQQSAAQESDEQQEVFVATPSITPPTTSHVQINIDTYCLFELSQETETHESVEPDFDFHPQKFLLTLFRVIISPNAP